MDIFSIYKIVICDLNPEIEVACKKEFEGTPIECRTANIFEGNPLCIISPANSFGVFGGGLDLAIVRFFGKELEVKVQERIRSEFHGELLIGQSFYQDTNDDKIPGLIVAPTMRTPRDIRNTLNPYYAFKSILHTIQGIADKGYTFGSNEIRIPGLGTLTGYVTPQVFAKQAYTAYQDFINPRTETCLDNRDLEVIARREGSLIRWND